MASHHLSCSDPIDSHVHEVVIVGENKAEALVAEPKLSEGNSGGHNGLSAASVLEKEAD